MQLGGQDALEPGAAEDERVRIVIERLHPGKDGVGLRQPQRHLRAKIPAGDELSALARQMRVDAECGACAGKMDLAKKAKELNLDAIHDTVHEMAKDEARHGRALKGLLDRYFGK